MRPAVLAAERIGNVGVVENVEEFRPELRAEAFGKLPGLADGEVPVAESCIAKDVPAHGAKRPERGRQHHRTAIDVTAERA